MTPTRRLYSRIFRSVLFCVCAAAITATARAAAAPSDAFAAGEAAFAAGDYAAALEAFERARDRGAEGPAVHYNIGVCEYRLGDYAAAAETFRYIAERFPAMREVADYNLGLALVERGRVEDARAALARAVQSDDDKIARLAAAMLAQLGPRRAGEPRSLVALVDVVAGHDGNVALVDELSLPAAPFRESTFVEALGYVDVPLGDAERFGFEATGYAIDYRDASPYDQSALSLGFDSRLGMHEARRTVLGAFYERTGLGGSGFEQRYGLELDFAARVGERSVLSWRLRLADVDELDARYAFVAGEQRRVRLELRRSLAGGLLAARYDWEDNDRVAASVSPTRDRLTLRWRRRLGVRWETTLGIRRRQSDYDELAVPRTEELSELDLELARDIGRGWQVTGRARIADNDASDPVYSYEREVFSVGLGKVF